MSQMPAAKEAVKRFEELDTKTKGALIRENLRYFDNSILTDQQRMFLAALSELGTITKSARVAGISPGTPSGWRKYGGDDPEKQERAQVFCEQETIAKQMYIERLEDALDKRAVEGVDKPVFYQGKVVGYDKWYSDNLLMFKLKGERPEKYREVQEHRHNVSGSVEFINRIAGLTEDELRQLANTPIKDVRQEDGIIDV